MTPYGIKLHDWLEEFSTFLAIIPGIVLAYDIERLKKAYRWASIVLILISIYAVYQYFFGWDFIRSSRPLAEQFHRYHATGFQDFHLTFAGVIGMSTPLARLRRSRANRGDARYSLKSGRRVPHTISATRPLSLPSKVSR